MFHGPTSHTGAVSQRPLAAHTFTWYVFFPLGDNAFPDGRATKWSCETILWPLAVVPPTRPSRVANTR